MNRRPSWRARVFIEGRKLFNLQSWMAEHGRPDLVGISLMTPLAPRGYEIAAAYRKRGIPVELVSIKNVKGSGTLTDRQARVLSLAYELGYFEFPKRINLTDLARPHLPAGLRIDDFDSSGLIVVMVAFASSAAVCHLPDGCHPGRSGSIDQG